MKKEDLVSFLESCRDRISKFEGEKYSPFSIDFEFKIKPIYVYLWEKDDEIANPCLVRDISETAIIIDSPEEFDLENYVLSPIDAKMVNIEDIYYVEIGY